MSDRLKAWLHWKELEIKKGTVCEDDILFYQDIKESQERIKELENKLKATMDLVEKYSAVTDTSVGLSKRAADKIDEQAEAIRVLREALALSQEIPEINMKNYTEDDVAELNQTAANIAIKQQKALLSTSPAEKDK